MTREARRTSVYAGLRASPDAHVDVVVITTVRFAFGVALADLTQGTLLVRTHVAVDLGYANGEDGGDLLRIGEMEKWVALELVAPRAAPTPEKWIQST